MKTRKASFSGSWYPENAKECESEICSFLKQKKHADIAEKNLVGGIVPHAGWYFSGSIACNVIHCLSKKQKPDVVVIFGMHLHPRSMPHLMTTGRWETPFGELEIAENFADKLVKKFKFNIETPDYFTQDNTIELQLPFIKYFFNDVKILPVGVPPADQSVEIAEKIVKIALDMKIKLKVIGSTDLTHYGYNYGFTPKGTGDKAIKWVKEENDRKFIDTVLAMNPYDVIQEGLKNSNACCAGAASAALAASKNLGAKKAHSISYATSYDKHPGDSFVGYAGIVFE